jgi:predicted aspartyl protease
VRFVTHSFDVALLRGHGMMDDMGIFRTAMGLENPLNRGAVVTLPNVMVDTGSEYTWAPAAVLERLGIAAEREARFETADGRAITRRIGYAIVHAEGTSAPDIVVFGDEGDMTLLGCRALEGLNLRVDVVVKKLVPAGPVPAAACGMAL